MELATVNWKRLFAAYGIAAVIVALFAGMFTMSPLAMLFMMVAVLAFELGVLLPIYVVLHTRGWITRRVVLLLGFLIGAAPCAWFMWPLRYASLKTNASSNGVQTMIDGVPTLAGWLEFGMATALFGMIGWAAAVGFWVMIGKRAAAHKTSPEAKESGAVQTSPLPRWEPVVVVVAMAGIVAAPAITKDRSCHNVFRDIPTYTGFLGPVHSARPKANLYLPARLQDWKDVANLLVTFGKDRNLSVLDMTEEDKNSKQLYVNLCDESGTVIEVLDRVYYFGPPMEPKDEQGVAVFGMRPDSDWRQQADALEATLRAKYGARLRREDVPTVTASELSDRLVAVYERPRYSIDALVDTEGLALPCRGRHVEAELVGAMPAKDMYEFAVTCEGAARHTFLVGTTVLTHEQIAFRTQKAATLPKVAASP